eukprot:TRINITY_DN100345_c0_g1_i1.p1 TRINITY_DN100345_c0_g1~~TRINITY_DN100345_c0_g1_i1.p1  ORF type:complete len:253 (-),score=37.87 TRINITY_DN100345_c0_g1_i1:47-748(-)
MALGHEPTAPDDTHEDSSFVLVDVESVAKKGGNASRDMPSAMELRWLRLASYFRPELDPCRPPEAIPVRDFFGCLPKLRLPLQSLRFGMVTGRLPASEVEAALTGTVVALCRGELAGSELQTGGRNHELSVTEGASDQAQQFLAFAFVHSFDFEKAELAFYSPVQPQSLQDVTLVLRGDIAWEPNSARGMRTTGTASPLQPYSSPWLLEGMGVGTRVVSTKGNIRRRKLRASS